MEECHLQVIIGDSTGHEVSGHIPLFGCTEKGKIMLKMPKLTLIVENSGQIQIERQSTKYLTSSLRRCQGRERQSLRNHHSSMEAEET